MSMLCLVEPCAAAAVVVVVGLAIGKLSDGRIRSLGLWYRWMRRRE